MIDHIYIPTLGSANNQITFDNMPPKVQEITSLVIQPKEKDDYPNYPTLVLPDSDIGITETRRWIMMNSVDIKYGVFDHDLKFIRRTPGGDKSKRIMNDEDWDYMLSETSDWLDEVDFAGFRQGNLPPAGKPFIDIAAVNCGFFFNGKKIPNESELDWSLPVCEDIHMVLQLFKKGYKNRIWDEFGYISKILVDGGCNEWRTLNLINDTHQKLIDLYPNYVSWNGIRENVMGGTFKKIKIKWKKMYTDSQLAKLPMD